MVAKNKKKVLFTSHTANFSKFNRPFMRWFKQQGYEVHYASAGEEEVLDCDKHFTIPFERSPFKLNNLRAIKQLKKIIDAEGYDIIHTHTPMGGVVTRLAAKAARKNGTRVIYTAHGFHFFKGAPLLNWLVYYPIESVMAKYTDTLITINKEDYERAKKKFNTDVQYVPGVGIDTKKFGIKMSASERLVLRKSLGLKKNDFVMIYPAEISKRKNQLWLIRSLTGLINENPDIHLLLIGQDSLNNLCHNAVKVSGLEKNIHFLGYRRDMPQLLEISDLAVSSALQEGLPVNILEAMSTGLPIVATDCRGNRDLVENGINGYLVAQGDASTLRQSVIQISKDKSLTRQFSINGRRLVERYTLADVVAEMDYIYNEVHRD